MCCVIWQKKKQKTFFSLEKIKKKTNKDILQMGKMEPRKVKEHDWSHTTHTMVQVRDDGELNQDIGSKTADKRFLTEVDRDPGTTFLEQVLVISCVMIALTLEL